MSATTTKDTELIYVPFHDYASGLPMVDDLSKAKAVGVSDTGEACRVSLDILGGVASDIDTLKRKTDTNARNISTNTADIYTLKTKVAGLSDAELPKQNAHDIVQLKGDVALINAGQRTQDTKIANNTTAATEARVSAQNADRKADEAVQKTGELRSYVDELASRIEKGVRQIPNIEEYVALDGEIVQFSGDTDSTFEHGGFYEWNGSAWVRVRVDARYKAGKDIEITEDGTINATFDHSPIEAEIKAVAEDLTAYKSAQANKDKAQDDAAKANTDAIATLNGGEQTSGSVRNTVLDYIGKAQHARFKVVQTLPPVKDAESNVLYLVPFEGKEGVYKQYILADGKFVQLDNTEVDLSDYYTKHETDTAISDVADALTAKDTEQDTAISARLTTSDFNAYKQQQAQTDKAQDDAIAELQKHEQVNADWNSTSGVSQILNKPNLHAVATSGSYNDLIDKPLSEGTSEFWKSQTTYIPKKGEIIIYTDYGQDEKGNNIPNFKVGDGSAFVEDLPFAGCDFLLQIHINDKSVHHEIGLSTTENECLIIN